MTEVASDVQTLEDRLERYGAATAAAVARYVAGREPSRDLYEPLLSFTARPGKGLRGAQCLASCEAFGGTIVDALPAAAAVELLHAAFMIHDDIEDASERRRGHSAMHVTHGVPFALNAGDALATLAFRPILENGSTFGARMASLVAAEFQRAMQSTVEGQAIELGWRADPSVELTPVDYLDMVLHKTCAYTTILPMRVGALLGSWGQADLAAIAQFGFSLGAAFQIQDDLLDVTSDAETYGKDVYGDVREGKRTLMMIRLLHLASSRDRAFVVSFLSPDSPRSPPQVRRVVDMMYEYGTVEYASRYAVVLASRAEAQFSSAFESCPPSAPLEFLRTLVPFMVERTC